MTRKVRFPNERFFWQALEQGKKVRHDTFKTVFHMIKGKVYDQDGCTWQTPLLELRDLSGWFEVE